MGLKKYSETLKEREGLELSEMISCAKRDLGLLTMVYFGRPSDLRLPRALYREHHQTLPPRLLLLHAQRIHLMRMCDFAMLSGMLQS